MEPIDFICFISGIVHSVTTYSIKYIMKVTKLILILWR